MLIHEIAKKSGTTKKAIQYYMEQNLLKPIVLENGYNDFSLEDEKVLKQIVLYRKLGLSIHEIKSVLKNLNELSNILHQRTLKLEEEKMKYNLLKMVEAGENVENLSYEINGVNSKQIIIHKLMELFPSYYGKIICFNFSRFLTGNIENEEQLKAFYQIIDFFDNVEELEITDEIKQYLDEMEVEISSDFFKTIFEEKEKALQDIESFVENNKEILDVYRSYKKSEEYKNSPAYKLSEFMKQVCTSNGYYDVFIPAMRKLSPLYNAYYEQLKKADDIFVLKYPEYVE